MSGNGVYKKPLSSGGVSRCVHCGERKTRHAPDSGKHPRTIRDGCKAAGSHLFSTETVQHGWSAR